MSVEDAEAPEEATAISKHEATTAEEEFRPFDEIVDGYDPGPIKKTTAADGLPSFVVEDTSRHIPVFSAENMVCVEDKTLFVQRNSVGKVTSMFAPEQVEQAPNGRWYRLEQDPNMTFTQEVEPIRPRCKHYVRQAVPFEANPENTAHLRLCSARRTTEGTFMSLRDTAVWACSMREPRDLESEKVLEQFDEKKAREGATRVATSIFGKEKQKNDQK